MYDPAITARPHVYVWDPVVRVGHWLLLLCITLAWLTRHGGGTWHEVIGYVSLVIVFLRLVWGWLGSEHARFADFVRGPRATAGYTRQMVHGVEPRYLGHNPLGGWMIIALLAIVLAIGLSGWLYTTDRFWGIAWVETLHGTLTDVLILLVALHVAGVMFASYRHRENLVASMLHGRKRMPDAKHNDETRTGVL